MATRRNFNERQNLQVRVRSIPACAGEPAVRYDTSTKGQVYTPRVRGNLEQVRVQIKSGLLYLARAGEPLNWDTLLDCGTTIPRACGGTLLPTDRH